MKSIFVLKNFKNLSLHWIEPFNYTKLIIRILDPFWNLFTPFLVCIRPSIEDQPLLEYQQVKTKFVTMSYLCEGKFNTFMKCIHCLKWRPFLLFFVCYKWYHWSRCFGEVERVRQGVVSFLCDFTENILYIVDALWISW